VGLFAFEFVFWILNRRVRSMGELGARQNFHSSRAERWGTQNFKTGGNIQATRQ
jgi:hypothetical protein